jgi:hypothetical protein
MSLCENEKNQKGGPTEKNPILSLYENENLKKGNKKKEKKRKKHGKNPIFALT